MKKMLGLILVMTLLVAPAGFASSTKGELTVYSGRSKNLIEPLIEKFKAATGILVKVRFGDTAEMAATILEEGNHSPADVFFAQDAGALGALAAEGKLAKLPDALLKRVDPRFRSPDGLWLGTSARARVVAYNTQKLKESDLPGAILGFTDPKWKGRIGWAPTNGSFQAFITAFRMQKGEEAARAWLKGILANAPKVYPNNSAIVAAVGAGEIEAGFVNHYYLFNFLKEKGESFPVRNYYLKKGDPGALINVAGAGIVATTKNGALAEQFIEYLLSAEAQNYFAKETNEYPLTPDVPLSPLLTPLAQIDSPKIDLGKISDLNGTLKLLQEVGALQ